MYWATLSKYFFGRSFSGLKVSLGNFLGAFFCFRCVALRSVWVSDDTLIGAGWVCSIGSLLVVFFDGSSSQMELSSFMHISLAFFAPNSLTISLESIG